MNRIFRKLSIAFLAAAVIALLMHATSLVLRLTMDIRQVYPVDFLLSDADAGVLSGTDALIFHLLRNGALYGFIAQAAFLLSQLMIHLQDRSYMKKYMEISAENQILLLKSNEKDLVGLADRIIPLLALAFFAVILVREWVGTSAVMSYEDLTRRAIILPNLTLAAVSWMGAFLISLLLSLGFLFYFRAVMKDMFNKVGAAEQ